LEAGEWSQAGELLDNIRLPNARRLRTSGAITLAERAASRGDRQLARRMLAEGNFDLITVLALRRASLEAELALLDGEPHAARAIVDDYLPLAELILDSTHARLSTHGLRSLSPGERDAADAYLAGALRRAAAVGEAPVGAPPDLAGWLAAAEAAHATVAGEPASGPWQAAAAHFGDAGFVVRRAWAQLQAATALVEESGDREVASGLAREVYATALRLGALPLQDAVESLARRARLDVPGVARTPGGDLGLTDREAEVLRLVAAGRTNREIAGELFISAKTASVHVSNILRKVGATNRGEAAAIAHREGLTP
jgi:DNA-binding CsgD family transcriptional regulator